MGAFWYNTRMELATLAGGCFWCTEAIFKRLKGVTSVMSGYTGGTKENPQYDDLHRADNNHAETIQIEFDPSVISYGHLLEIFFHLHDPTTINQQGYDVGKEYRSAIFYHDEKQREVAERIKKEVEESGYYKNPIVTEIVPFTKFYKAEEGHQNYYEKNSYQPYCQLIIDPKIQKLFKEYSKDVKPEFQRG